jgi:hypothetical protein
LDEKFTPPKGNVEDPEPKAYEVGERSESGNPIRITPTLKLDFKLFQAVFELVGA